MSRGPGVWQRKILNALATHKYVWLQTVLPEHPTRAQRFACRRAAHRLAVLGRVTLEEQRSGEVCVLRLQNSAEVLDLDAAR